jgi:hypothetical protein
MLDVQFGVIVDVEASPGNRRDEVACTQYPGTHSALPGSKPRQDFTLSMTTRCISYSATLSLSDTGLSASFDSDGGS